jgi:hypothetical protein
MYFKGCGLENKGQTLLHCVMIDSSLFSGAKAEPITALVGVASREIPYYVEPNRGIGHTGLL